MSATLIASWAEAAAVAATLPKLRVLDLSRTRMAMPHGFRRQLQAGAALQQQEQQQQQQRQQPAHDQASAAADEVRLADWGEVGGVGSLQATQLVGPIAAQLRALVLNDCFVTWDQVSEGRPAGFRPSSGDVPMMRRASWHTLHQRVVFGLTLKNPQNHAVVLNLVLLKQHSVRLAMLPHQQSDLDHRDAWFRSICGTFGTGDGD